MAALGSTGGWLHVHENVREAEVAARGREVTAQLVGLGRELLGGEWTATEVKLTKVKWYAPHVRHIVWDVLLTPISRGP